MQKAFIKSVSAPGETAMTAIEAGDLLWQPQEIEKTQLYQFSVYVHDKHGFDWGGDYERLWQWSVDYPELFWSSLWDWS